MQFFLFSFSPSSPLPSPPPSERTRGTASSRQAEKEKRRREKEGLWRRDKGLSVSVCHLIHRPLLRPAGPSVICCHTRFPPTFTHSTTTATHTHIKDARADAQTLTHSPPCFTHSLRWHARTQTLEAWARKRFLATFTATSTNTAARKKPHKLSVGLFAPFHTFSSDDGLTNSPKRTRSETTEVRSHALTCTYALPCQTLFRKVEMQQKHTRTHTLPLRPTSWILSGAVQFCPCFDWFLLRFFPGHETRRGQPLPVLCSFSVSGLWTHVGPQETAKEVLNWCNTPMYTLLCV